MSSILLILTWTILLSHLIYWPMGLRGQRGLMQKWSLYGELLQVLRTERLCPFLLPQGIGNPAIHWTGSIRGSPSHLLSHTQYQISNLYPLFQLHHETVPSHPLSEQAYGKSLVSFIEPIGYNKRLSTVFRKDRSNQPTVGSGSGL